MHEMIPLFPGRAPGSENLNIEEEHFQEKYNEQLQKDLVKNVTSPGIYPFLAKESNGTAFVIIPGGAFKRQVLNLEGSEVAKWLNSCGMSGFVLKCRQPVDEHVMRYDVSLIDIQRAIRIIRARAEEWGISRIGVMGFSAGGYVAAVAATAFDEKVYEPVDDMDLLSARPDLCVLGYPGLSCEVQTEAFAKKVLEGKAQNGIPDFEKGQLSHRSPETLVREDMPPVFLFETDDDKTTPAENSLRFYQAARKKGVSAEIHIFRTGTHGFGLGDDRMQAWMWKDLFLNWLKTL